MKKVLLLGFALMLLFCQYAHAQSRTVTGKVTDQKTSEGLPGATVLLKGTTAGVSTNADGGFSLIPYAGVALGYLRGLVDGGAQGLENGKGFYDWTGRDAEAVRQTLDDQLLDLTQASLALRGTV